MFTIEIHRVSKYSIYYPVSEITHILYISVSGNTNQIINNIFQNDKYIKYSQTNMKSIVRGGIDD